MSVLRASRLHGFLNCRVLNLNNTTDTGEFAENCKKKYK